MPLQQEPAACAAGCILSTRGVERVVTRGAERVVTRGQSG